MRSSQLDVHARGSLLVRLLLIAAVMAGLLAMHVLSQHDAGGGHGAVLAPAAASTGQVGQHHPSAVVEHAAPTRDTAGFSPAPPEHGMSMAECILFLAAAVSVLIALLLAALTRRRAVDAAAPTRRAEMGRRRGPPWRRPPRLTLCVLRV